MAFKPRQQESVADIMEKQQQEKTALLKQDKNKNEIEFTPADEVPEKIRIIFDDSGSMSGDKIKDARAGCIEFLRNCVLNQTACAVHILNPEFATDLIDLTSLTTNLPALSVLIEKIRATGGTPLTKILWKALKADPKATRLIVFSDGAPTDDYEHNKEQIFAFAIENKIPVDTVLIWDTTRYSSYQVQTPVEEHYEYRTLKELADKTNGYFLVFDRSKVDFKSAFKYLAPNLRGKLSDGKVRLALQAGELK